MQVSIDSVRPAWIKSSSDGSATAYREHINQRPTLTYREHTRPTGGPMNHLLAHPRVQGAYSCDSAHPRAQALTHELIPTCRELTLPG